MRSVHFVLQGKGGVGKSFIAALLAQYLHQFDLKVICFDTDPVNQTFSRYQRLNVQSINILTEHKNIDASCFDALIETLIMHDGLAVIDNGASTFVPLMSYMRENEVVPLLQEAGVQVVIHVPLQAGQGLPDTLTGLNTVLTDFPCEVVVWLNHYWGRVETQGKTFEQWNIAKNNAEQIAGVIELSNYNPDTYGRDILKMTSNHLTFQEVLHSSEFTLMPKQRLKKVQRDVFEQLAVQGIFAALEGGRSGS